MVRLCRSKAVEFEGVHIGGGSSGGDEMAGDSSSVVARENLSGDSVSPIKSDILVCPETKLPLKECSLEYAKAVVSGGAEFVPRREEGPQLFGNIDTVMLRADGGCAYPVVRGIPILLVPEMLVPPLQARAFDLSNPKYREAYEEMEYYNAVAEKEAQAIEDSKWVRPFAILREASGAQRSSFPAPLDLWLDAVYDAPAQGEAYAHIAPLAGKRVLQVGGKGIHAVKFLCAGAREAWVVTPMLGELVFATTLAQYCDVQDRLHCVAGIAEELPFADGVFDAVYAGGCVHHFVTELALPECARVLRPGGRFAAVEPWRAPLYGVGTRVLGKREEPVFGKRDIGVCCSPLSRDRLEPFFHSFQQATITHHGTLTRYPMLALYKLGMPMKLTTYWKICIVDDFLCSLVPPVRRIGSSVSLLGTLGEGQAGGYAK